MSQHDNTILPISYRTGGRKVIPWIKKKADKYLDESKVLQYFGNM